jgi:hypothetical protein
VSENHHEDDKTQIHTPLMNDPTVGHYRIVGEIAPHVKYGNMLKYNLIPTEGI